LTYRQVDAALLKTRLWFVKSMKSRGHNSNKSRGTKQMIKLSRWILVAAMCAGAIPVHADDYGVSFLDVSGSGLDATGTFSYANGIFSNFDVSWDGYNLALSSSFSSPSNCAEAAVSSGATLAGCPSSQTWNAAVINGNPKFFIDGVNAFTAESVCFSITQGSCVASPVANGTFTVADLSVQQAPEIDPASAASGLTFLLGGLLVLRGRGQQGSAP
jgi:hypothetical protein